MSDKYLSASASTPIPSLKAKWSQEWEEESSLNACTFESSLEMIPDFTKRHLALFLPTTLFFHTLDCHYWTQIQIVEEFIRPAVRYRTPHLSPHPYIFFRGGGSIAALKLFIWEINLRLSQTRQTWNHKPNAREMLSTMADSVAFFFFFCFYPTSQVRYLVKETGLSTTLDILRYQSSSCCFGFTLFFAFSRFYCHKFMLIRCDKLIFVPSTVCWYGGSRHFFQSNDDLSTIEELRMMLYVLQVFSGAISWQTRTEKRRLPARICIGFNFQKDLWKNLWPWPFIYLFLFFCEELDTGFHQERYHLQ